MDERIESFLKDVLEIKGVPPTAVRDGARSYLAIYENLSATPNPMFVSAKRRRASGGNAAVSE